MARTVLAALIVAAVTATAAAQDLKPVPKNSVRVFVTGCGAGYVFTAGRPAEDQPGGGVVPEGTRLRMSGPKKLIAEIRSQEGSRVELTGIIKRGQLADEGMSLGGGVRVGGGGPPVAGGGAMGTFAPGQNRIVIDVEGWRPIPGSCPTRD